jgi:hypothetical protein
MSVYIKVWQKEFGFRNLDGFPILQRLSALHGFVSLTPPQQ